MIRTILTLLLSFTIWVAINAQSWQIYDMASSGLPSNRVQAIAHSTSGTTWIGTDWGLASFDGINWVVYQMSNSPLPENDIRALAIDANDALWIGTFQNGVVKYDGVTWTAYNINNSDLPENQVKCIAADSLDVWIGTVGGLAHFNGTSWKVYDSTINTFNDLQLPSSNIAAVAVRDDGLVSIGTVNGGFTYLTDSMVTVYSTTTTNLPDNTSLGVVIDSNGDRWAACPSGALLNHVGPYSNNLWFQYSTANSFIPSDALNAISIDANDNIYVATQINGIGLFEPPFNWTTFNSSNSNLPDNVVLEIEVDALGRVWCGTETGGLAVLNIGNSVSQQVQSTLDLFPNPTADFLYIRTSEEFSQAYVQVFDITGKICLAESLSGKPSIDVSGLLSGTYLFRLYSKNSVVEEIIVRQ